jgi:hypothetical protein
MANPVQRDIDCVASLVEAASELQREPFFGKDEKLTYSDGPTGTTTYQMGDRFHFRSALISFRRIWMQGEASHWKRVVKILKQTDVPPATVALAQHEAAAIAATGARDAHPTRVKTDVLVHLWLNTVFAHDGLTGPTKRADFEAGVRKYGHAPFEYAFRVGVKHIGGHFINLSRLGAQPALSHYEQAHGLKPSFQIGAAFGSRRREKTADGHTIIRQGSSEFFTEETVAERFTRVLDRHIHRDFKFVLDHLNATHAEKLRAVLRATSIRELLTLLDGEFRIVEMTNDEFVHHPDMYASAGLAGRRVNVHIDNVVQTHANGEMALNRALAALRRDLLHD